MKTLQRTFWLGITLLSTWLFVQACNPCGNDNPKPRMTKISNFEPINTVKSTHQWLLDADAQVQDTDYRILLNLAFEKVVQLPSFNLFATAYACSPANTNLNTNIQAIHIFSFGNNHTYQPNQKLDSLFGAFGTEMEKVNQAAKWNNLGMENQLALDYRDPLKVSDTLQFKVLIKLDDGRELEQATKKIIVKASL